MKKKTLAAQVIGLLCAAIAVWTGINVSNDSGNSTASSTSAASNAARLSTPSTSASPSSSRASGGSGSGKSGGSGSSGLPSCPLNSLPTEADEVAHDILAGGPFDHPDEDGSHFGNYQRILPRKNSNFYREYTVETPGVGHRGARRIVVGGGSDTDPDVWYYTDDHYESFCEIPDAEK
ncbi:ribonuclease domain-containing protein [Corynebacterium durum]|uniref:ribonuclease domain-containing protein n=2 Tax=Corynebacterium durum TaxID=61592 RepID=UPI0028EA9CED|nr:ribonuclease domain-containing protein [Corynebacterium durum]